MVIGFEEVRKLKRELKDLRKDIRSAERYRKGAHDSRELLNRDKFPKRWKEVDARETKWGARVALLNREAADLSRELRDSWQ